MHSYLNPASLQPNANFSHGVVANGPFRWLSVAGQVARDVNGVMPEGIEAQADLAWSNVFAVLREAGMEAADILEVNVYLINKSDDPGFNKMRNKWLGAAKPASTKVYVSGLADPRLLCEVQVRAAKAI